MAAYAVSPISTIVFIFLHTDLRIRKEGLDVQSVTAAIRAENQRARELRAAQAPEPAVE